MRVYLTVNLVNLKCYVGRDSLDRDSYLGSGVFLKQAIKKYGRDNFIKVILEKLPDDAVVRDLIECEKRWIAHFDAARSPVFYNMSSDCGGFGVGDKHTEATKSKIRNQMKRVYEKGLPPAWKENVRRAAIGRTPWNKGLTGIVHKPKRKRRLLDDDEIAVIRAKYAEGLTADSIGKQHHLCHHTILKIVRKQGRYKS